MYIFFVWGRWYVITYVCVSGFMDDCICLWYSIGQIAQLVECWTEKPDAILVWVQFLCAARDFSPTVSFQCRLSSSYGVHTAPSCSRLHQHLHPHQKSLAQASVPLFEWCLVEMMSTVYHHCHHSVIMQAVVALFWFECTNTPLSYSAYTQRQYTFSSLFWHTCGMFFMSCHLLRFIICGKCCWVAVFSLVLQV